MKNRTIILWGAVVLFSGILFSGAAYAQSKAILEIESGVTIPGYSDIRVPGNSGTDLSLTDELESDSKPFIRFRATYAFNERHSLSLLAAPLRIPGDGVIAKDVTYQDYTFTAGTTLKSRFRFDSYRLTYIYALKRAAKYDVKIGFTGKIRDASISLESATVKREEKNTGFVPLIYFAFVYNISDKFNFRIDGDALAAPQGRAEDIFIGFGGRLTPRLGIKGGYRFLEGGADIDKVYNFSLTNYISLGITAFI